MTLAALKIITRAVTLRLEKGEDLETILSSYTKLTPYDKEYIRSELQRRTAE